MSTEGEFYLFKLKEELSLRQRGNPHYSLRAYARDLGLHSSTLSSVLKGYRRLPLKRSQEVANRMKLTPRERTLFLKSLGRSKSSKIKNNFQEEEERFVLDEAYYKVIAEWEHFAVETLLEIPHLNPTASVIAERLGIPLNRAMVVVENLKTCGLIRENGEGQLVKVHSKLCTTEDISSQAIRAGHLESLEMAKQKLEEVSVESRDFSSVTIAMNLRQLPAVKHLIRDFRKKLIALVKDGEETDVFQVAIQLYPLTKFINDKEI